MKQRAFSLIELIFAVVIISVIAIVAIPNFKSVKNKTDMVKIKSDIALIRDALNQYKNKNILSSSNDSLDSLDDGGEYLFINILKTPIIATTSPKASYWMKVTDTKYKVWLDTQSAVEFVYNSSQYTFECDFDDDNCKELTQ